MSLCTAHIQIIMQIYSIHIQVRKHTCCHVKGSMLVYYLKIDKYNYVYILEDVTDENEINQDKNINSEIIAFITEMIILSFKFQP